MSSNISIKSPRAQKPEAPETTSEPPQKALAHDALDHGERGSAMAPSPALVGGAPTLRSIGAGSPSDASLVKHSPAPVGVNAALEASSLLLGEGKTAQAIQMLASLSVSHPQAEDRYAYHSRYAQALLGHIELLDSRQELGHFTLHAAFEDGGIKISEVTAERLSCLVGVCKSYTRLLSLLESSKHRAEFIKKNSAQCLEEVLEGSRHGLGHAVLEIRLFIIRICQYNSNSASAPFVDTMLAQGGLHEDDSIVRSFREAQAEPLYQVVVKAAGNINASIDASGEAHTLVWRAWSAREISRIFNSPVVAEALRAAPREVREAM